MAVAKANAYGHRALEISKYLEVQGVRQFVVASINEAIELREGGIKGEILVTPIYRILICLMEM